jgi:hypothetical protein
MSLLLSTAVAFGLQFASFSAPVVAGTCPGPVPEDSGRVANVITLLRTNPQLEGVADLGTATVSDVRALTDDRDRDACAALGRRVAETTRERHSGERMSFYRSGDRYFVTISPGEQTGIAFTHHSVVEVYDGEYHLIARLMA